MVGELVGGGKGDSPLKTGRPLFSGCVRAHGCGGVFGLPLPMGGLESGFDRGGMKA